MKRIFILTLLIFGAVSTTANAAPSGEEAVVNIVTGYCLSAKMGTALPAGVIDPRSLGKPLTARSPNSRLSDKAVRIPTASGAAYYDYNKDYCYAHAAAIDGMRTIASLQAALQRLGLPFEGGKVTYREGSDPAAPGKRRPDFILLIDTPSSNPNYAIIAITHAGDNDTSGLSVGVALSKKK